MIGAPARSPTELDGGAGQRHAGADTVLIDTVAAMDRSAWPKRLASAIPRGVMLGFGTLFQPRSSADDHWSVTPKVQVVEEAEDADSGAPPRPHAL